MGAMYTTPITKNRFSGARFPVSLKGLMDERQLSYRQLAYKTQAVGGLSQPPDQGHPASAGRSRDRRASPRPCASSPTSSSSSACGR